MPSPKGQELGMRNPFVLRVGSTISRFRGTNTEGDPSCIGDDQFRTLTNVDFDGSKWNSRPGLAKLHGAAAMTGCVYGIWDDEEDSGMGGGPVRLFGGGYPAFVYDTSLTDPIQQVQFSLSEYTTGVLLPISEQFRAQKLSSAAESETEAENETPRLLISGLNGNIYTWSPVKQLEGQNLLDVAPVPTLLCQLPGLTSPGIKSMVMWEGVLYILVSDTVAKIFSFDGQNTLLEDTCATDATYYGTLGVMNGEIIAAVDVTAGGVFRKRNVAGAWSNVPVPAEITDPWDSKHCMEYGGGLYIFGDQEVTGAWHGARILKWDGSTLTTVTDPLKYTSYPDSDALAGGLAIVGSNLCYLWQEKEEGESPNTVRVIVGTFDGSTWTTGAKVLTSVEGGYWKQLGIVEKGGNLYVVSYESTGSVGDLYRSPGSTITGTWSTLVSGDPAVCGFDNAPGLVSI